jgi:hypothetical protein
VRRANHASRNGAQKSGEVVGVKTYQVKSCRKESKKWPARSGLTIPRLLARIHDVLMNDVKFAGGFLGRSKMGGEFTLKQTEIDAASNTLHLSNTSGMAFTGKRPTGQFSPSGAAAN